MIGASKILTVSYGTFSCTLEGFDEPFNTMTAIAEYFRDLAADDRYFGAEPPTPDAAMLHQIAEREMNRRVDAKIEDNGVILRASDSDRPAPQIARTSLRKPVVEAPVDDAVVEAAAIPPLDRSPDALFEDQHANGAARGPGSAPGSESTISESVAAKLSRIRHAMAETRASGETTRPPVSIAAAFAEAQAEIAAQAKAEAAEKAETEAHAEAKAAAAENAAAEAEAAQKAEAEARAKAALEAAEKTEAAARAKAEADAVEKAEAEARAKAEAQAAEDAKAAAAAEMAEAEARATAEAAEKAEAEARAAQDSISSDDALLASLAGGFDEDDNDLGDHFAGDTFEIPPGKQETALDNDGDDTLMSSLAAAMAEPAPQTEVVADDAALEDDLGDMDDLDDLADLNLMDAAPETPAESPAPAAESADLGTLQTSFGDGFAAAPDGAEPQVATPDSASETTETKIIATLAPETEVVTPAASATDARLQRARARVIKIRRAPTPEQAAPEAATAASSLSAEAEAELERELAETRGETVAAPAAPLSDAAERDLAKALGGDPATITPAEAKAPVRPQRPASARRLASEDLPAGDDDASMKRLIDQTNTELQGPENRRRLSAIAHLRAAVAATVADRKTGGGKGPTDEMRMNPYRNDLERVVRPRPATADTAASQTERPAPLMLVSEQRIDTPRVKPNAAQTHITPVRPRRVASGSLALSTDHDDDDDDDQDEGANIFTGATSFADYVEMLGAEDLPQLLEAAAAYGAHVEGRSDVSRLAMVDHIYAMKPALKEDRETVLRSFGTLLREGRLQKTRHGHFVLSETSPLYAEAEKAAKA
ncbi:hypothetical protein [Pseudorhodobacter sp.]|uniref:hypothetical protein n=1 Tax=Pseudorhodobacter sp. TaxID=1934400 RepID=UPI002648B7DF|nr:hypothetical protein [Pseudorhodobacter sp.]MDN5786290.1 hypothetical protein [Pseudorhodobacter sp.]